MNLRPEVRYQIIVQPKDTKKIQDRLFSLGYYWQNKGSYLDRLDNYQTPYSIYLHNCQDYRLFQSNYTSLDQANAQVLISCAQIFGPDRAMKHFMK